jgi:hypothetical protein
MARADHHGDPSWRIEGRRVSPQRVEAVVDGVPVWAACDDIALADRPEAWGTAFALPAARAGVGLRFDRPVDGTWARGAQRNVALAASWWGGAAEPAWAARGHRTPAVLRRLRRPAAGRAVCFTGGVDSFFSLLGDQHQPTHLLYVVGFDVGLDDTRRIAEVTELVRTGAAARGLQAAIVLTDLREHPRFASISWEHTHGAALAAVGHLLSGTIGTLVIPPSYAADRLVPWGSRPDLDPGWSVPGRLQVEHGDAAGRRLDRVRAIAHDPLVHRHLRVCWQNVGTDLNCGRCEKCVRTMAMLAGTGELDRCETFPGRADLPDRIRQLGTVPDGLVPLWTDLLATDLQPAEQRSIEGLLATGSGG